MQTAAPIEITKALRMAVKAKGLTYRDLADKIGVSEQTIKRLFREKDCSLSRLTEVCDAIQVSVYDLLEVARDFSEPTFRLEDDQEAWLVEHPSHFSFLFILTAGYQLDDIRRAYGLDELTIFKYLRDLDRQGLIELSANNQFKLKVEGKLLMKMDGPMSNLVRERNHLFLDYALDHHNDEQSLFISSFRQMSADTLNALSEDLDALMKKYRKAAYQDEAILPRHKLVPVKWSMIAAPFDICGIWPIETNID